MLFWAPSRFPGVRRGLVVAQERPGTLGGGLDVVAARGEAAPVPQAHRTAPYRPRYSLDQRTAGQYLGGLGTHVAECTCSVAEHPEGIKLRAYRGTNPSPTPCLGLLVVKFKIHILETPLFDKRRFFQLTYIFCHFDAR